MQTGLEVLSPQQHKLLNNSIIWTCTYHLRMYILYAGDKYLAEWCLDAKIQASIS